MRDIFREALARARKSAVWDRLAPDQREALVTRCIQKYFEMVNRGVMSESRPTRSAGKEGPDAG
jgi:hypothetical protein